MMHCWNESKVVVGCGGPVGGPDGEGLVRRGDGMEPYAGMVVEPRHGGLRDAIAECVAMVRKQRELLMQGIVTHAEVAGAADLVGARAVQHAHLVNVRMPILHAGEIADAAPDRGDGSADDGGAEDF